MRPSVAWCDLGDPEDKPYEEDPDARGGEQGPALGSRAWPVAAEEPLFPGRDSKAECLFTGSDLPHPSCGSLCSWPAVHCGVYSVRGAYESL